jgi:hypothetical protein
MKITRVHAPSLNGDYVVEAADEATGQRYRFCADRHGVSAVFLSTASSGSKSTPRQRWHASPGWSCAWHIRSDVAPKRPRFTPGHFAFLTLSRVCDTAACPCGVCQRARDDGGAGEAALAEAAEHSLLVDT